MNANANALSNFSFPAQNRLLLGVLREILGGWALLKVDTVAKAPENPGMLALEMRLTFYGDQEGRLVLRASTRFGRRLVEATLGEKDADEESARDALGELCNLVGKHLASQAFSGEGVRIRSSLPESSTPLDWPAASPVQALTLGIAGETLEARLWMWKAAHAREKGT